MAYDIVQPNPSYVTPNQTNNPSLPPTQLFPNAQPISTPSGWDAQTYANFKKANPTLEPTPEDTRRMLNATPSLNISTGNPALKSLFDSTNAMVQNYISQGGTLTPEIQQRIQAINDAELQKQGSVAGARTAADNKDASALDTHITTANTAETTQQSELQSLLAEMKTARQSYIGSLAPTQAEQDLTTKLNTLRTERKLLPIELRQEGISAPGIAGRQSEDERVRAIQEQNLLLEIGLKQDARKMASGAYKDQIGFIQNDITLQQTIQDKLDKQEQQLLENARNLSKDSLSALSNIVNSFKGLAWTDLDPQTQSDVSNLLKNYPDLTPQIVADAMKIGKQQQIFDNAIKAGKGGTDINKPLSSSEIQQYQTDFPDAGITAGDTRASAEAKAHPQTKPQTFTDEELRTAARDNKTQNKTYDQTIAEIDSNPAIQNKDRAKLIASEIYGVNQKTSVPTTIPAPTTTTTTIPNKQTSPLSGIGTTTGLPPINDLFKKLFGQ